MAAHLMRVGQVWHFRFQLGGKRIMRSTGETVRKRAEAVAAKAFEDATRLLNGAEPVPTLRELVGLWIETVGPTVSSSHVKGMTELRRLHLYELVDMRIDLITTAHIEAARNRHLSTHKPSTVNHWTRLLRLLFKWAVRRKMIGEVPWLIKPIKVQKQPRALLPAFKASAWLEAIDALGQPSVSVGVRLMLGLGLREIEVRTARWNWLDWERRLYTPGQTKGREAVPMPVPDWLVSYLQPLRQQDGLIVTSKRGKQRRAGFASPSIKAANAAVGVIGVTPHRLRGTYATMLSEAGVPVQNIQQLLRHKNVNTTIGYLEVDFSQGVRGQAQIAERLGLSSQTTGAEIGEM